MKLPKQSLRVNDRLRKYSWLKNKRRKTRRWVANLLKLYWLSHEAVSIARAVQTHTLLKYESWALNSRLRLCTASSFPFFSIVVYYQQKREKCKHNDSQDSNPYLMMNQNFWWSRISWAWITNAVELDKIKVKERLSLSRVNKILTWKFSN